MSPIGADNWRIRYLGPWTWREHGQRDGWTSPHRRWGWRLIITVARGERLDIRGTILDVIEAGLYFPNVYPVDQCGRCLPGYDSERIPIYLPGEAPCEHTRSNR